MLDGAKIDSLMKEKGITNQEGAAACGISATMMCYIRQGKRKNPGFETVEFLADKLGVTTDELRT